MGKPLNLLGQRFGKLVVISKSDIRKRGMIQWNCQCDCGNTCVVPGPYLKNGNTTSCGCQKREVLKQYNQKQSELAKIPLGTRFGKLTVIEDLGLKPQNKKNPNSHNRRFYLCKCDCGKLKEVNGNLLKNGQVSSCGCLISVGETVIQNLLEEKKVKFEHDKEFPLLTEQCGRKLRFDFIIYNKDGSINRFVEFDGRQHIDGPDTKYWGHSNDTLETIQERDKIKNNFCIKNNFTIVRIPYYYKNTLTFNDIMGDKFVLKGV